MRNKTCAVRSKKWDQAQNSWHALVLEGHIFKHVSVKSIEQLNYLAKQVALPHKFEDVYLHGGVLAKLVGDVVWDYALINQEVVIDE